MQTYSIAELSRMLSDRVVDVAAMLLPAGKRVGGEWCAGDIDGSEGKSLKVTLNGEWVGQWKDWSDDAFHGDLVDLWERTRSLSRPETLKQVKEFLGVRSDYFAEPKKAYALPVEQNHMELAHNGKVMNYLVQERKLEPATVNRFMVRADKRSGGCIVLPRYSPAGVLVNNQYIGLDRDEKGKKRVFCEKDCAPALFGWQALDSAAYKSRTVLICEGEIDAMTWTQWGVPALSISNGSGTSWVEYEWENLEAFSTIYLSFDTDGKSDTNLQKCLARLGLHRCRIVTLPHKDANDCLKAGCTSDNAKQWVAEAKWPERKGIVSVEQLRDKVNALLFPDPDAPARGWTPELLKRPDGHVEFLWGDMTAWTGVSSQGKTTLLNDVMVEAINAMQRVCICSLEVPPERTVQKLVCRMVGAQTLNRKVTDSALDMLAGDLILVDRVGQIGEKELIELFQFAYARWGVHHFVLDSLMRVENMEEDYKAQTAFMNSLQSFIKQTTAHLHIVAHSRKIEDGKMPSKQDIKGSNNILNNTDNILAVGRNPEKAKILKERALTPVEHLMWDSRVTCEKQRETGWEGSFYLKFDPITYTFSPHKSALA